MAYDKPITISQDRKPFRNRFSSIPDHWGSVWNSNILDQKIEQLQQYNNFGLKDLAKVGCSFTYPNFFLEHPDKGKAKFRCKSWRCPECYPLNKRRLMLSIIRAAELYNMRIFVSLTIQWPYKDIDASFPYINDCWDKLLTTIKRKNGKRIKFFKVVERHKSGVAHIHILTDQYLDVRWLRPTWVNLGGGKIMKLQHVDIQHVSAYLSKYFSKSIMALPKGIRHYSKNIKMVIEDKEKGWQLLVYRTKDGKREERKVDKTDFVFIKYSECFNHSINEIYEGVT